ncbi:hypothetical protein IM40_02755 [Candidatus Paracaedimonas acanthamoebae]|nr:hypothetical protein IM40_02755 [Candidatus Paracaedimonas acanthamoebae]
MKKKLKIGLMLLKSFVLPLATLSLDSPIEAAPQGGRGHNVPINLKDLRKATINKEDVFEYLLSRDPHATHIAGRIYTLPNPVTQQPSSEIQYRASIEGYPLLDANRGSLRLDIKPDTDSNGAILEFQLGRGTVATVLLKPNGPNRSFTVEQIVEGLYKSVGSRQQVIINAR